MKRIAVVLVVTVLTLCVAAVASASQKPIVVTRVTGALMSQPGIVVE